MTSAWCHGDARGARSAGQQSAGAVGSRSKGTDEKGKELTYALAGNGDAAAGSSREVDGVVIPVVAGLRGGDDDVRLDTGIRLVVSSTSSSSPNGGKRQPVFTFSGKIPAWPLGCSRRLRKGEKR